MRFERSIASTIATIFVTSVVIPASLIGITESGDEWSLVIDGKSLELIPELEEYCWVLDRPPYEPWDRIALRRLVKIDGEPLGTIFILPGTTSSGDQIISDDVYCQYLEAIDADQDKINEIGNKVKEHSICHYLALRGFEVYSMDYRTHFVPMTYDPGDLGFMKSWGWTVFIEDTELAVGKAKEISGADKLFLGGESFGGMLAMNYASMHWEEDLEGIVLLDGGTGGKSTKVQIMGITLPVIPIPFIVTVIEPVLEAIMHITGMDAMDSSADMGPFVNNLIYLLMRAQRSINLLGQSYSYPVPHYPEVIEYATEHPLDPPIDPVTGKRLEPQTNPITGKKFANYIEWAANLKYEMASPGFYSNLYEGYNDAESLALTSITSDRYWPMQVYVEFIADVLRPGYKSDGGIWTRDYYNFYAHYKEIDVPLIAFISRFGLETWGEFNPGIANHDVTGHTLPEWGHYDIYTGVYNPEMVNEPTYQWLLNRL